MIYLDHAAATPLDEAVLEAMLPYYRQAFYNPSATYAPALDVARALAEARGRIAGWLGVRPGEIIFTAGGTEADNLAVHGIMSQFPDGNIVVSAIEHEAVLAPAAHYDCRIVQVDKQGFVDLQDLAAKIDDKTVLVSIMYANNEIGTIEPLKDIAQFIKQKKHARHAIQLPDSSAQRPLYFHTDACQAAGYLDLHAARLGVDLMTLNGGKIYGPKQSAVLMARSDVKLQPLISGGGQEHGRRSGTENVAASVGLARALDISQSGRREESMRLQKLQRLFFDLLAEAIPLVQMNGSGKKRLPNNVHITLPGFDNERLLLELETAGILAAAGSACSAASGTASHVLEAIGLSQADARSSLRFSLGRATTEADIRRTVQALATITGR